MPMSPGPGDALEWVAEDEFRIGPVSYVCRPRIDPFPSAADRFCLRKPREAIEAYAELLERLAPRRIFEVGLYECGSTALIAQLARPEKLVGVDIEPRTNPAADRFAAANGFAEAISLHWEVDQADAKRLRKIAASELGGEPLDLVIDDASHLLDESRATFETLFPLLRPGGLYVLEDWAWAHAPLPLWPDRQPLTVLVAELTIACAARPELVAGLEIDRGWAVIERGPAEPDEPFALADALGERGRRLVAAMQEGGRISPRAERERSERRRSRLPWR